MPMDFIEYLSRAMNGGQFIGGIGLALTLVGAVVTARSVRIDKLTSGKLAAARWSSADDNDNADLPLAISLRRQSEQASRGLYFVAAGTVLQISALAQSLFVGP